MKHRATIYHNPDCATSRNTLALIRHLGMEAEVIYYLQTPPDEARLRDLLAKMNLSAHRLLRTNVPPYPALGLADESLNEDVLIQAMLAEPLLINRPIVVTETGVRLCRPSEVLLEISPVPLTADFVKEDGEVVRTRGGYGCF